MSENTSEDQLRSPHFVDTWLNELGIQGWQLCGNLWEKDLHFYGRFIRILTPEDMPATGLEKLLISQAQLDDPQQDFEHDACL